MTEVAAWLPGRLYQPGDLTRATNSGVVTQPQINNPDFEDGDTNWIDTGMGSFTIDATAPVFHGTQSAKLGWTSNPNAQTLTVINDARLPVSPGQLVTATFYVISEITGDYARIMPMIQWYAEGGSPISATELVQDGTSVGGEARINSSGLSSAAANGVWVPLEVTGIAPSGAASWSARFDATWGDCHWTVDYITANYADAGTANTLLFRAVQAAAGFSGSVEPVWPASVGLTVVDNEVTWEAVSGNSVTWQANRILVSGSTEPGGTSGWPETVGASIADNTIVWILDSRQVTDTNAPQSEIVLIAASKIYAADVDIVPYCATVNPLDWTTPDDAGYLAFGLQQYGANPVTAMGLYRGNVVVFNSQGCQIWQADEDPAAITLLDAMPIPCTFPKSVSPVGDDLVLLTNLGIRSLALAGASVNLSGGWFGKQVDPLVVAAIAEAEEEGWTPRALYWPAHGQYWLFFGAQAFVLTINGPGKEQKSWSRYTFPWVIDAWTLAGEDLYLRAGELVELVDVDALIDDLHFTEAEVYTWTVGVGQPYSPGAFDLFGFEDGSGGGGSGGSSPSVAGCGRVGGVRITSTGRNAFEIRFNDQTNFDLWWARVQLGGTLVIQGAGTLASAGFITFDLADAIQDTPSSTPVPSIPAYRSILFLVPNGVTAVWTAGADIGHNRSVVWHINSGTERLGDNFTSEIQWPFLDFGTFNQDKELIGFDLAVTGVCQVSFGWSQRELDYDVDGSWTELFEVDGDTVPDQVIGFSMTAPSISMYLTFENDQAWEWWSSNLYIKDEKQ